jgi:hypothetical protein
MSKWIHAAIEAAARIQAGADQLEDYDPQALGNRAEAPLLNVFEIKHTRRHMKKPQFLVETGTITTFRKLYYAAFSF